MTESLNDLFIDLLLANLICIDTLSPLTILQGGLSHPSTSTLKGNGRSLPDLPEIIHQLIETQINSK